jgi:hypothetical protein
MIILFIFAIAVTLIDQWRREPLRHHRTIGPHDRYELTDFYKPTHPRTKT